MAKNVLIIVEGKKTEPRFFERLNELFFESNLTIYCLETNIYSLYIKLKEYEFNANITDLLIEVHPDKVEILKQNFAYTYLIFDCDPHHPKKEDNRSIKEIVLDNFKKLEELASYFTDETDPTIGKLYINYPMMESYRDCDDFFDENYESTAININDVTKYKSLVHQKKLAGYSINKYTTSNFESLILQNLYKLNKISTNNWAKPSYNQYLKMVDSINVLNKEKEFVEKYNLIQVLNTSLLLVTDYYGNRNYFYDKLDKNNLNTK